MRRTRAAAAGFLLLTVVGAAQAQTARVPLAEAVPSITVDGTARREVPPDLAVVSLGVTTDRPAASDAAADNARAAASVVAAARQAGLAGADIQTSQLRLAAIADQHDPSKTRGFQASNEVTLRVRDLARLGGIVGQMVASGANTIEGIEFEVADPAPVMADLRTKAMEDAQAQARTYAAAAGAALGRVLRIVPSGGGAPVMPLRALKVQAAIAPPPVEAGSSTLETRVQVTWELAPAAAGTP